MKRFLLLTIIMVTGLLLWSSAVYATAIVHEPGWNSFSQVSDTVTGVPGNYTYAYTVHNTSVFYDENGDENEGGDGPLIIDWELPWFGDANISNILSPDGWYWTIETIGTANASTGWDGTAAWQDLTDPWYQGSTSPFTTVTEVLHWYTTEYGGDDGFSWGKAIFPYNELDGFGFTSNYTATDSPYQASWVILPVQTGDPAFPLGGLPASPGALGQTGGGVVPEPGTILLLMTGLLALAGVTRFTRE